MLWLLLTTACSSKTEDSSDTEQSLMEEKSMEIGPSGGSIELSFTTLTIPEGALDKNVSIKVSRYGKSEDPNKEDYYELSPSGLEFNKSITISIATSVLLEPVELVYPKHYRLGYLNDGDFSPIPTQNISQFGILTGVLRHFFYGCRSRSRKRCSGSFRRKMLSFKI
jgi:hypothetical protein